jgi:hypothetical protein
MARPSIRAVVIDKVSQYVKQAEAAPSNRFPLSVLAVATAIGHDRRVLKKYGLDVIIAKAAKRQAKRARSASSEQRNDVEGRISAIRNERDKLADQVSSLLARAALIEGNAKRLGIDPEELYKPLMLPDRRVSAVFGRKPRV